MLNFIYYPVSWIMWVWHWLFEKVLPDTPGGSGVVWALSVVFLVFTLRAILYKPFVKQIQTTKKMQEINPQMQAVRKKYANDRVKMTEEMQKLQKEHGFNPLLGCLPMLMQIPVFIGLFHVLRSFNRMGTSLGQEGLSAEQTRSIGNYAFNADQVQNFLDARLFGIPLSSFITQPETEFQAFVEPGAAIDFTRWQIAAVVVPLMIIASFATHMNSRASVSRQSAEAEANPQTRIMNKLALWVFPLGILVTGPFFPAAILLYWVSNNGWTYVQQHLVFGRIAKEEEAAKKAKEEKLKAAAPRPGEKPLPGNFDPKKTMDRAYLALSEGRKNDAAGEFRKVVRYGQRKDDWIYRGANGIARAAFELALLTDEVDVRAALAEGSIDAARKDATKDGAGLAALERYLSLRFWQLQGWVASGDNSRVVGVFTEDSSIVDAYETAWGEADRPADLAPYRRASLYRLIAVGHFQAGQSEDARNYAGKAAAILSALDVDPGIAQELAQVKLISAAPQTGRGKRSGSAQQRTADGQEALALLTDAANEPGAGSAAKRRAEQAGAWVQSIEALGGKGSKGQLAPIQSAGKELVADLLDAPDAVNTIIAEREITAPAAAQPKTADAQGGGQQRPRGQQGKSKKKRKGGRI